MTALRLLYPVLDFVKIGCFFGDDEDLVGLEIGLTVLLGWGLTDRLLLPLEILGVVLRDGALRLSPLVPYDLLVEPVRMMWLVLRLLR
ncbi:MAG: hypothetical protein KJO79_00990 [Verrucomicrobiae bacterium]|nr:hypothetical protein [Verrucomicrobiae bacterium]NNJ85722.1 hypothetical protein [Akkermansiaceae bacterium]